MDNDLAVVQHHGADKRYPSPKMACLPGQALPTNKHLSAYDARLCFGDCSLLTAAQHAAHLMLTWPSAAAFPAAEGQMSSSLLPFGVRPSACMVLA